jgi:hypothetical protein
MMHKDCNNGIPIVELILEHISGIFSLSSKIPLVAWYFKVKKQFRSITVWSCSGESWQLMEEG